MKVYNTLTDPLFYVGSKFGPLDKRMNKRLTSVEKKYFRTARYALVDQKRNEEIFEEFKIEPADKKLKRIQIRLATTCNKNEQQQDARTDAEL
jgi:hypothetical protein